MAPPRRSTTMLATPALGARATRAAFLNEELRDHGSFTDEARPSVDSDHAALVGSSFA